MQRILVFIGVAPIVSYLALSGLSNIDKRIQQFRVLDSRQYYRIKSFEPGKKIEISIEAMSFDHAFRKGLKEINKTIEEIKNEYNIELPIQRPLYAYQPEKKVDDINNSSKNYNFHYNLYYPLASDIKLDENSKYNDLIKTYDSDIVAVRTIFGFPTHNKIEKNVNKLRLALERDGYILTNYSVAEYHDRWVFYPFRMIDIITPLIKKEERQS